MIIPTHSVKMIAALALVMMTVAGLASCGGGGGGSPPVSGDQMTIMPVNNRLDDHSNTPEGSTEIALSKNFQGRIDSSNDVDYFRLGVDALGTITITITIRTTGTADPHIVVFDGAEIRGAQSFGKLDRQYHAGHTRQGARPVRQVFRRQCGGGIHGKSHVRPAISGQSGSVGGFANGE